MTRIIIRIDGFGNGFLTNAPYPFGGAQYLSTTRTRMEASATFAIPVKETPMSAYDHSSHVAELAAKIKPVHFGMFTTIDEHGQIKL